MGYFMQILIETLHNSLLYKAGVETISGTGLVLDNSKLEIPQIKSLIELLSQAKSELKYAVLPQLPLELAIVEWCSLIPDSVPLARGPAASLPPASAPSAGSVRAVGSPSSGVTPLTAKKEVASVTQQGMEKYNESDALRAALIDNVKIHNHSVAGVLRGCVIKSYDGKTLLLETNYKFHKDKLNEAKTMDLLNKACKEVTKKNVKIEIILKGVKK
jgi:hypothetical protein